MADTRATVIGEIFVFLLTAHGLRYAKHKKLKKTLRRQYAYFVCRLKTFLASPLTRVVAYFADNNIINEDKYLKPNNSTKC